MRNMLCRVAVCSRESREEAMATKLRSVVKRLRSQRETRVAGASCCAEDASHEKSFSAIGDTPGSRASGRFFSGRCSWRDFLFLWSGEYCRFPDDRSRYRVGGVLNSFSVRGAHAQ